MEASPHTKKLMTNLYNKFFQTSIEEVKERAGQAGHWKLEAKRANLLNKKIINRLSNQGMAPAQIAEMLELHVDKIKELQEYPL